MEGDQMDGLPRLAAQRLEERPRLRADIPVAQRREAEIQERRTGDVRAREGVLPGKTVVPEHGEEPVGGRAGDADRAARFRDPDMAALPQHVEQLEGVVDRLDGVGRALRNAVLHSRNSIAGRNVRQAARSGDRQLTPGPDGMYYGAGRADCDSVEQN